MFASVVVIFFTLVITGEWKDFRTASLATALTLAAFAIWHLLRAPWILERKDSSEEPKEPGFFAGAFGIVVIVGVFIGGYELAIRMWELRPVGTIQSTFAPPPQPIIEKGKSVIVHGACKLTAEQINPARLPQPCSGPASPTLRDRVLAINAHMTEGDRNRFSNALSEFEESLKEGESILYRLSNEGNVLQRERQDGTIAKDVKAHQKVLSDIAADGWKYYRSFPALRVKWQTIFSQQTEYIFGDNPDNGGSGLLLNAEEAYRIIWGCGTLFKIESKSLTSWVFRKTSFKRS